MAAATRDMLMNELLLFEPVMQQSYLQKQFARKFYPIEPITLGSLIEFLLKNSQKLYLDLNNSRIMVQCRIVKTDGNPMPANDACRTAAVNNLLHSLFKEVTVQFNNKTVSDSNNMYAFRAYIEKLLNLNKDIEKYRLNTEGWHRD